MMTKHADIRIELTVKFEDDGENDLKDQAINAACEFLGIAPDAVDGIDVVGNVRDTQEPTHD